MGTQQLLMIVVGAVIVILTVYAGFNIYSTYAESSNRDQLISTLYDLGLNAQQYVKKPVEQGGGGGIYSNWTMPEQFRSTEAGSIRATVRDSRIDFSATGTEIGRDGKTKVNVTARVDESGIRITVRN
jgi:hypothetical protein